MYRFSPIKESMMKSSFSFAHHGNKMINSCSQTEEPWNQYSGPSNDQKTPNTPHFENPVTDVDRRYVYKVSTNQSKSHEKAHSTSEKGKIIFLC